MNSYLKRLHPLIKTNNLLNQIFVRFNNPIRCYSSTDLTATKEGQVTIEDKDDSALQLLKRNQAIGIDMKLESEKRSSVLQFPWPTRDFLSSSENVATRAATSAFWKTYFNNTMTKYQLNTLYRQFHQWCAIPEYQGMKSLCEPQLYSYLSKTLKRIHFYGLDVEMQDLTVDSKPTLLDVSVHKNLSINRQHNGSSDQWKQVKGMNFLGSEFNTWKRVNGQKYEGQDALDFLESDHKPYLLSLTVMFQGPMRLIVYNQNRSAVLFGSESSLKGEQGHSLQEEGHKVRNVLKFEIKMKSFDFFKIMPVGNKFLRTRQWKLVDFNGVMNGNPYFLDNSNKQ